VAVADGGEQAGPDVGQVGVGIAGLVPARFFAQFRAQLQSIVAVPGLWWKQPLEAPEEGLQCVAPVPQTLAEALFGVPGRGVVGVVERPLMATEKVGLDLPDVGRDVDQVQPRLRPERQRQLGRHDVER